ncbi:MAG: TfuA-like protein [Kofleriaceae bacterium]
MIVLFTGPTLPASEVPALPELRVLPPVAQGDVYRVARERPWGIGIVDGYFEHVPAVWHKEILWAMAQGVHVFGAASIGALRAAELADFGMVGVGKIFEHYRDGALTADDEVAVTHLSAEHGYRRVSEALVDIRATLAAAVAAERCSPVVAGRVIAHAEAMFYADRTWPKVLAAARTGGEVDALEAWLGTGRVDQKRRDAVALVEAMRAAWRSDPQPLHATFAFQHTDIWDQALRRMQDEQAPVGADPAADALLDELRLLGDDQLYTQAMQGALLRGLAQDVAERRGVRVDADLVHRTALAFRRTHGMYSGAGVSAWLDEQGLDPQSYFRMMTGEAQLRWTAAVSEPEIRHHLPDQLRAMSCHGRLQGQARAKQVALAREGLRVADLIANTGEELWRWYFEERLGKPVPADLAAYADRFGFGSTVAMRGAVALERWYTQQPR